MIFNKKIINNNESNEEISKFNDNLDKINGWFFVEDICVFDFLLLMQNKLNITGNLLEIGVFEGKSLFEIAKYCKNNETLFGLDICIKQNIIENYSKNFKNTNQIKLIQDSSLNIKNHSEINNIRFCHIDGCHEGEIVYEDIINANNYSKDETILVLDDFAKDYIGIMQAYYKAYFTNKTNFIPFLHTSRKSYFCQKTYYPIYYEYIKNNLKTFINNYNNIYDVKTVIEHKKTNISDVLYLTNCDYSNEELFNERSFYAKF